MLKISNLTKIFSKGEATETVALKNINLEVEKGEVISVVGSNGAGKSTLLNVISGRILPDFGQIVIEGKDVTNLPEYKRAKFIGRVFQNPLEGTATSLTIEENLALAFLSNKKRGLRTAISASRRKEFKERLKILDLLLENRLTECIISLSGGERQALTLLMAVLSNPSLLLLDEYTASLDPKTAQKITFLTNKILKKYNLTTIMVTHNMAEALKFSRRLLMMHKGEIILDIKGAEKKRLTIEDLLKKFSEIKKEKIIEDKMLLI